MLRRDLITAGTLAAVAALTNGTLASGAMATAATASDEGKPPEEGPAINIAGLGLPVIADNRIRNYVFVTVRLHLGGEATSESMRSRDPFFRDALVRTAHRAPFTLADDWTRLNEVQINAAVMAIANVVSGRGSVIRSEVVIQTPRRRTGVNPA